MTQQAVEKTKKKLYDIVRKIFDDGLRSPTIGEKIETPEYYVQQLSSLIDEEKGEREFVLYCPKCRSTMEKIKMVTNSQEK